jgi:hypothetical protein
MTVGHGSDLRFRLSGGGRIRSVGAGWASFGYQIATSRSGIVTVSWSVVEVDPIFHPDGGRLAMKPYPKGWQSRRIKLSPQIVAVLVAHAKARELEPDDLFFRLDRFLESSTASHLRSVGGLGMTEPYVAGRT